jgi:thioredoxin-dependent peroxiredoxin
VVLRHPARAVAGEYGVWKEKSMCGRRYQGIERSGFVIAEDGRIQGVQRRGRPERHADWLLEVLEI